MERELEGEEANRPSSMATNGNLDQDEAVIFETTNNKTEYESFSALNLVDSENSPDTGGGVEKSRQNQDTDEDNDEDEDSGSHGKAKIRNDEDTDFKLPELDWDNLEAKLKLAQQEVNQQVTKQQPTKKQLFSFINPRR